MYHLALPITIACCIALATVTNASAAQRTFKPGGVNGFFSNPANWEGGVAPVDGDDLILPYAPVTQIVNDIPNLRVNSFTVFGQYNLTGQPLSLAGVSAVRGGVLGGSAILWFDVLLTLDADQLWDLVGTSVIVNGELRLGGHSLIIYDRTGPGQVTVNGPIRGAGRLVMSSIGRLVLNGANTFTGQVIIESGQVVVSHPDALGVGDGTAANGTIVQTRPSHAGSLVVQTVDIANEHITLSGRGWANEGALISYGAPKLKGPIELVGEAFVRCDGTGTMIFEGPISGNGRLILGNSQTYVLANSFNSFTGGVQFGTVPGATSALIVTAPDTLPHLPVIDTKVGSFTIDANSVAIDSLKGAGSLLVLGSGPGHPSVGTVVLKGQGEATFDGSISGNGGIVVFGTLNQTITNGGPFSGTIFINLGTLTLANTLQAVDTLVDSDGRLALKGTGGLAGNLHVWDGMLLVGAGTASNVTSGPLQLRSDATFEVSGSLPAALAKLTVTGAVDLADATLSLALPESFSPAVGQAFTIVENDDADPIVGTFKGLPEGSTIGGRGVTFTISYVGGSGNDVVLTATNFVREYYLSEGATGTFFNTDILISNPNLLPTTVDITFLKSDGTTVVVNDNIPAQTHRTLNVNGVAGMQATAFSTIVKSDTGLPLAVERTMWWDAAGYGSHTERAVDGPAKSWYFAEGSQGFFSTYVLLANPQTTANSATVRYLLEGSEPIVRTYPLEPSSRYTIDIGADAELVNRSFGMTVTFAQPGIAERAMYFGSTPLWKAGHESAGVTAPSTTWFLAEGATGSFFETFVLLANPNPLPVTATLTFLPATGQPVVRTKAIPGNGRVTVNIEGEDPSLASAAVATSVSAPAPIIVERSQYWPDPAAQWFEAHNSFGVVATGMKWGLAEGRVGGDRNAQTYILLANPGTTAAQVEIRFLRENATYITNSYRVEPGTRFNVSIGSGATPALDDENFGAVITSTQPIVVERALYWDAGGITWAAGSNATATPLPF